MTHYDRNLHDLDNEPGRVRAAHAADVRVENHGSIVLLVPLTDNGREWIVENIGEGNGFQPYFPTVVAEPRYVQNIIDGMMAGGLVVA